MRKILLAGAVMLAVTGCDTQTGDKHEAAADAGRLEADVRFLADDLLEGREAGSRGYDIAAKYVAERYRSLGLEPGGGDGTYYQTVPMRAVTSADQASGSVTLSGAGAPASFERNVDYVVSPTSRSVQASVTAPVVFVGFGFVSEDYGRDDYEGLDVEGKIVALLYGSPKSVNSEERAHYNATRSQRASERGAIGTLTIWTPELEQRYPFERAVKNNGRGTSMVWLDANGEPHSTAPNIKGGAAVGMAGAQKLFANAPASWEEILAAAETDEGEVPAFDLDMTATIVSQTAEHNETAAPNVVGILRGSDPALRDEYVILTAHLDHVGIRPTPEEGDDELHNGAMDNAAGTASLLEAARLLAKNPPRRSVVFVALTAEEKGLVGSDYYAHNPTVPKDKMVANINLDMPIVTYAFTDVIAFGAERSTLYPEVEAAAARAGLTLSPDPDPAQGLFTRSDQYSFVKQGVPALFLKTGFAGDGEAAQKKFRATHYHKPSDEPDLVDYEQLRRFAQVNYEIAVGVATMDARPVWKKGDFFGRTFGGPMEEE